jgi:hypothetical protein
LIDLAADRRRYSVAGLAFVLGAGLMVAALGWPRPAPESAIGFTRPAPVVVAAPTPTATPPTSVNATADAVPRSNAVASRLVIGFLGVDLPVISDEVNLPGNPEGYPLCDVAQYLSAYRQPGEPGATYLFAHAQPGMLLKLLKESREEDGRALLGQSIFVFTSDGRRHDYTIFEVKRHAIDWEIADDVAPGEERLVIQTSEGPSGTPEKLQIAARPVSVETVGPAIAQPSPEPRACPPTE